MEAQTTALPFSDDPSSAAAYPRWVMLERDLKIQAKGKGSSCSTPGPSSRTLAAARTSTGHLIQVSLRLAEPPAVSCVCLETSDVVVKYCTVVAAHGDSVLIKISTEVKNRCIIVEQFLYSAGDAAADPPEPPSLRLFPLFPPGTGGISNGTGIARRGEDELVVAQLRTVPAGATPELMTEADLYLFRYGEWSVKRLQITSRDGSEVCPFAKSWNAVFPVGDGGLLCWVDLWRLVVLLCDVFEETPRLQRLSLPKANILGPASNRNVCATAAGAALKFVNIFPRCCCGEGVLISCCKRSRQAYTIHTWTARINDDVDAMEWVMDGVVDATELWALDSYKGLRCLPVDHPVVSMVEPELIYFWMHQPPGTYYRDRTVDLELLGVNMTSKTIHSVDVSRYENGLLLNQDGLIPSNVSYFFNSYRPCSGSDGILTGQGHKDIERTPPAIVDAAEEITRDDDHASNPALQPAASCAEPCVHASEIFEAFQEITSFGLDQDEIVKAYSILSRNNGRRFNSFIRLPKNGRKNWLSMAIKACKD